MNIRVGYLHILLQMSLVISTTTCIVLYQINYYISTESIETNTNLMDSNTIRARTNTNTTLNEINYPFVVPKLFES